MNYSHKRVNINYKICKLCLAQGKHNKFMTFIQFWAHIHKSHRDDLADYEEMKNPAR
jgi:hypothetical protein